MRSGNFDRSGKVIVGTKFTAIQQGTVVSISPSRCDRCVASIDPTLAVRHAALGGIETNLLPPTCLTGCDAINRTGGCPVKNPLWNRECCYLPHGLARSYKVDHPVGNAMSCEYGIFVLGSSEHHWLWSWVSVFPDATASHSALV